MMKMLKWLAVVVAVGVVVLIGCSQNDRDEIADRVGNAGRALSGESATGEKTPRIVKEQQRKERIRQNNTWTPENRALHPVEYCQAQLEELQKYSRQLEARAHEKATAIAAVKRELGNDDTMAQNLSKFLEDAKKTFRASEAANTWPANINGFLLSREKAQEKIIDTAQKLAEIQSKTAGKKNQLAALESKVACQV